ncbi:hypothetical protein ETAA8_32640 [Anatilimnocola aggregata]|uniref:3-keto-alpha-glucoside-1,2-lyase/3-keto-2-hydroxy-glucal hydratase domain-containing protein n=1 Tax=Anatilimnocola aggregata TaxID=2528021 RepID=A0A517YD44_9BACT|nr:DUF1080 domain-containing protein [Anatilimnocola aggregata]QDU28164.1 hypothetical protein ETAA8_32640 [Anatilimnocola aggregata]
MLTRLACLTFSFCFMCASLATAEEGFTPLFDGKSLAGWKVMAEKNSKPDEWTVVNGVLTAKAGNSWLATEKQYGDYVLKLEWRVPENGNSGIFIRVPELKEGERPWIQGIEIQVLDDRGPIYMGKLKPWQYSGSIYGAVAADQSEFAGAGKWNAYEITCRGDLITVVLNGKKITEGDMSKLEELKTRPRVGFIGLQNHGTDVEYRNLRIKELSSAK